MKKKSILIPVAVGVVTAALSIGGTLAWLTGTAAASNHFTIGNVTVEVKEDDWNENNASDIAPNATIAKDPRVQNTGKNPCYVRVKVVKSPDGIGDYVTLNGLDTANWIQSGDYYYYVGGTSRGILAVGDTTSDLFQSVSLGSAYIEGSSLDEFDIDIYTEAIQSENLENVPGSGATTAAFVSWLAGQFDAYGPNA